jgi:hypothetical protein
VIDADTGCCVIDGVWMTVTVAGLLVTEPAALLTTAA